MLLIAPSQPLSLSFVVSHPGYVKVSDQTTVLSTSRVHLVPLVVVSSALVRSWNTAHLNNRHQMPGSGPIDFTRFLLLLSVPRLLTLELVLGCDYHSGSKNTQVEPVVGSGVTIEWVHGCLHPSAAQK